MSKPRHYRKLQESDSDTSSESEVEYEPIVVTDADGNEYVVPPSGNNPLAPIVQSQQALQPQTTPAAAAAPLLQVAPTVHSSKVKAKKGKVFVSKDRMLSLIETVNTAQDAKVKDKLDRDLSFLKRSAEMEAAARARKEKKQERLEKIKENLRKGGVRLKGENKRKVREIKEQQAQEKKQKQKLEKFAARQGKAKRKVKFAE